MYAMPDRVLHKKDFTVQTEKCPTEFKMLKEPDPYNKTNPICIKMI